MHVDKTTVTRKNGKEYTQYLLRTSTRQGKKIIKTTHINITPFGVETCEAIKFALANKDKLVELGIATIDLNAVKERFQLTQDKPIGDVWLLQQLATKIGITEALGDTDEGRLALWQVIARTLDQGSRLSDTRLARNPVRANEIAASRKSKLQSLSDYIAKKNEYLSSHRKASPEKALQHVQRRAITLKIDAWIKCEVDERKIMLQVDDKKLSELSLLDGCYCLTTNVSVEEMDKESVHARYKDLAMVEEAFRTCKTGHLELRPIYVRKEGRTRAHVFVVMLSYLLVRELREAWCEVDATVEECLSSLSSLCGVRVMVRGNEICMIPNPRAELSRLFKLSGVVAPKALPKVAGVNAGSVGGKVDTNRKLPSRRKL